MQGLCMKKLKYLTLTTFLHPIAVSDHSTHRHIVRPNNFRHCNRMRLLSDHPSDGRSNHIFSHGLNNGSSLGKDGFSPDNLHIPQMDAYHSSYILERCTNMKALTDGDGGNARTIRTGFELPQGNDLISMYVKSGSMTDARQVFDKMHERNLISWNVMIKGYARHGFGQEALELFCQMQSGRTKSDPFTFVSVIRACGMLSDLELCKQVHTCIIKVGFELDVFVGSALVDMYAKWDDLEGSCKVFDKMAKRDIVSWNTLIAGYARNGHVENALQLFCLMQEVGMKPDQFTFASILRAFASLPAVEGEQVHVQLIKAGFESDVYVESILVDMYAKSGSVGSARKVFDEMSNRDIVCWTTMVAGYAQNGQAEAALELFQQMQLIDISLNQYAFTSILSAFVSSETLKKGKQVHAHIIKIGFESDVSVGNALVTMYCKCGSTEDARRGFDKMLKRDVVSWTAMIAGYAGNGYGEEALDLFRKIHRVGMNLNKFALTSILSAFAGEQSLEPGKQLHTHIIKTGFEADVPVGNALVSMYAKCGSTDLACQMFDKIVERDCVSWNAMIAAYAQNGHGELALKLFGKMQQAAMKSNQFTFASVLEACASLAALEQTKQAHAHIIKTGFQSDTSMEAGLIDVYGKCGNMDDAQNLFDRVSIQNVVSWNAMIGGYIQNEHIEEALKIFCKMQAVGIEPNRSTYASILRACASLTTMEQGKQLHGVIIKTRFESDVYVGSALVDMYAKCGSIEDAHNEFEKMPERNVVSWNVMITGCAQHGCGKEALQLFEQMQQAELKPNDITFVGVLYACCHVGLVDEGLRYFDSMSQDHGIMPRMEHYACVIDLLGRAGHLDEASEFIKKMPFDPDALIWQIFLGACRNHGNMELGKHSAQCLLELQPQNTAAYVLLSNIYAKAERWDDVSKLRKMMKDRTEKKDPGCSWIEVKKRVHSFVVEDRSHPQAEEIYAKLKELNLQMIEAGYVPDTSFVLQAVG